MSTRTTLEERISRQEQQLAEMKARAAKRDAIKGDGFVRKLALIVRSLRSVEKHDQGDLAVECGNFAQKLDDEIARIIRQAEPPYKEAPEL